MNLSENPNYHPHILKSIIADVFLIIKFLKVAYQPVKMKFSATTKRNKVDPYRIINFEAVCLMLSI